MEIDCDYHGQKEYGQDKGVTSKKKLGSCTFERFNQTWKRVGGPAEGVMCETRDRGIKWPHWHTLIFSNDTKIDMRFVCPKHVKKMLVQRACSVYWKNWAAKHEYIELKEGAWLEPGLALLLKNVRENWTEKRRNVARNVFLEGGWTQKRLLDIGWSDVSQMSSLPDGGRHREAQAPTTVQNCTQ